MSKPSKHIMLSFKQLGDKPWAWIAFCCGLILVPLGLLNGFIPAVAFGSVFIIAHGAQIINASMESDDEQ